MSQDFLNLAYLILANRRISPIGLTGFDCPSSGDYELTN